MHIIYLQGRLGHKRFSALFTNIAFCLTRIPVSLRDAIIIRIVNHQWLLFRISVGYRRLRVQRNGDGCRLFRRPGWKWFIMNFHDLMKKKKKKLVINGLITALRLKSWTESEQLESYQYRIKLRGNPVFIDGTRKIHNYFNSKLNHTKSCFSYHTFY